MLLLISHSKHAPVLFLIAVCKNKEKLPTGDFFSSSESPSKRFEPNSRRSKPGWQSRWIPESARCLPMHPDEQAFRLPASESESEC
jgi:hypothetical protein